ncbi:glycosyltransferase family 2 protein [Echinicola vietnamensis]|uniref:Glycosyl transferase n=1 Tax=Echinicola vietnamensis (strain DSM 17526 / LMG 23754 / KMM 6221) TaxID=926556 RepID=L0G4G9_ECHVK|nr:glycosyltransferase [Echinicola vietnamensis]AGA80427.1 glycosyl transferase [Echinicola vietnamensis DSM 17526]
MNPNNGTTFSICIPAYKSKHLHACIASILGQTIGDFELIILNDCSPQPVEEVVSQFDDKRIQYHKNETNVGAVDLVQNWNKCLSLATGKFIVIMGDDDLLEPDYLETFTGLIAAHPDLDVYHCRSKIIDENGNTILLTPACPATEDVYDSIWHRLNQYRSNYISDYLYRTEALRDQGGFHPLPLAWGSDDITAFIAMGQKGIAHSPKAVFRYRSHGMSITSTTTNGLAKLEADMGYAAWLKNFLQENPLGAVETVIYRHLVENQDRYMRDRRIFTMTKIMASEAIPRIGKWLRHRKKFQLTTKDILTAAVKSRKMRKQLRE